jgi:uncharacterized protein (TIGR02145 family)
VSAARVAVLAEVNTEGCCDAPNVTTSTPKNFTAFNPCSDAAIGSYWYLRDTRENNNNQTYKVKKMHDGHIWMVQDLKFGDKCESNTSYKGSVSNQTGLVTSLTDKTYYGECTNLGYSSTYPDRGYLYDWPAAINQSNAYVGGSAAGCSGTGAPANACQGICPSGWHVPTSAEYSALNTSAKASGLSEAAMWDIGGFFEPAAGICIQGADYGGNYWSPERPRIASSTDYGNNAWRRNLIVGDYFWCSENAGERSGGTTVRCAKNY